MLGFFLFVILWFYNSSIYGNLINNKIKKVKNFDGDVIFNI